MPRPPDRDGHRLAEAHADRLLPRLERLRAVGREVSGRVAGVDPLDHQVLNVAAGGGQGPRRYGRCGPRRKDRHAGDRCPDQPQVRGLDPRQIPEDGRLQPQMGIVGQDRCAGIGPVRRPAPRQFGGGRRSQRRRQGRQQPRRGAGTGACRARRTGGAGGRRCGTDGVGGRRERGRRAGPPRPGRDSPTASGPSASRTGAARQFGAVVLSDSCMRHQPRQIRACHGSHGSKSSPSRTNSAAGRPVVLGPALTPWA